MLSISIQNVIFFSHIECLYPPFIVFRMDALFPGHPLCAILLFCMHLYFINLYFKNLYSMHYIMCIVTYELLPFYALYSIHCVPKYIPNISFYAFVFHAFIFYILVFYAFVFFTFEFYASVFFAFLF